MKLYGVWYADYSNSSVDDGLWSNRDDAVAIARERDGYVIEFVLDPPLSEKAQQLRRPGSSFYRVTMNMCGNEAQATEEFPSQEPRDEQCVRVDKNDQMDRFLTTCWATSEDHAIKIANDRRTQWIAAGAQYKKTIRLIYGYDYGWRDCKEVA